MLVAHTAAADDARSQFQAQFAEQIRQARLTPDKADDRELAERMLAATKADDPAPSADLARLLCDFAYTLASAEPAGYPTAVLAMELLAEKVPDRAVYAQQKIISLYRRHYATARGDDKAAAGNLFIDLLVKLGDKERESLNFAAARGHYRQAQALAKQMKSDRESDLDDALADLDNRERVQRKIDEWKKKLDDSPSDAEAHRELLNLYLIDLDDPAAAIGHLELGGDADHKRYIPLAAQPLERLDDEQLVALGRWYAKLMESAPSSRKPVMLDRAEMYFDHFLIKHRTNDETRSAVVDARREIEEARGKLSKLPGARKMQSKWIDGLSLVDPAKHWVAYGERWQREDSGLVATHGGGFMRIPLEVRGSYKVRVRFFMPDKAVEVWVALPVGRDVAPALVVNQAGKTVFYLPDNKGSRHIPALIEKGREHVLEITILEDEENSQLIVDLDGRAYMHWNGPRSQLIAPAAEYRLEGRTLGLRISGDAKCIFRSFEVQMINGAVKLWKP